MTAGDPEAASFGRRRIKQREVMVAEAVRETADAATLVLFTGNDRLDYRAGPTPWRRLPTRSTWPSR
jgi:hypothetical protein